MVDDSWAILTVRPARYVPTMTTKPRTPRSTPSAGAAGGTAPTSRCSSPPSDTEAKAPPSPTGGAFRRPQAATRVACARLSTGRPACRPPVDGRSYCPRPGRRCDHVIDTTFIHAHHIGRRAERLVGRGLVRIRRRRAAAVHDVAGRSRTHARPGPVDRRRSVTAPPDGGPGGSPDPRRFRRATRGC
jgi:hypothetical protein